MAHPRGRRSPVDRAVSRKRNGPEVAKALRYYRKRLKTAREYQRGYYARNRTKILQQRKQRAERER